MNTNLFVFIDQLCHSTKKHWAHHVNNFIRTPQTDMVNKLDSIHTQLAIQVLAKQAIKNTLCMTTTTIFFSGLKMILTRIFCWGRKCFMCQFVIRIHFHIPHQQSEQVCEISHHTTSNTTLNSLLNCTITSKRCQELLYIGKIK